MLIKGEKSVHISIDKSIQTKEMTHSSRLTCATPTNTLTEATSVFRNAMSTKPRIREFRDSSSNLSDLRPISEVRVLSMSPMNASCDS